MLVSGRVFIFWGRVGKHDRAKVDHEGKSPLLVASNKAGSQFVFSPVQLGKKTDEEWKKRIIGYNRGDIGDIYRVYNIGYYNVL